MRSSTSVGSALAFGLIALTAACNETGRAPDARPPSATPPSTTTTTPPPQAAIVFASYGVNRQVFAVPEDGSRAPVLLSKPRDTASFAGVLPGRRALIATHAPDGSLWRLDVAAVDSGESDRMGELPTSRWDRVVDAKVLGDAVALELGRLDAWGKSDVVTLRRGGEPKIIAENATLVAVAAGRVAFKTAGNLESAPVGGGEVRALGAADGQDHVMDVRGERLLVTLHDGGAGDVRVVTIDGKVLLDLGAPGTDDRAFAFASDDRIVLTHASGGPRALASVTIDPPGGETAIGGGTAVSDMAPIAIADREGGTEIVFTEGDALRAAPVTGGAARTLDAESGASIRFGKIEQGLVFFTGGPHGNALRGAKLDGSGVTELCHEPTWLPFFSTVTSDGRAVFYRALLGQIEGGRLFSVKLDGTDMQPVADEIKNPDGTPFGAHAADQDFEIVTPSGRLVLEAEFEGPSHLLVSQGGIGARRLADLSPVKFAALVLE